MKRALAASVAAIMICGGCNGSVTAQDVAKLPSTPAVSDGWQPGERIIPSPPTTNPGLVVGPSRQGTTPDGLKYTMYPDGSGSIANPAGDILNGWSIDCQKDAMNDRRDCSLTSHEARIFISYDFGASPRWVCLLGHDFPGRTGEIRVDKSRSQRTDTDGCVTGTYVAEMVKGTTVTTRLVKWPYDYSNDGTGSLQGLPSALGLITFIRANIDKLSFAA